MLMIRFQRMGRKNFPSFRAVVIEKTKGPYGKALEIVGHYNPLTKKGDFDGERIKYWLSRGAHLSETLASLLKRKGIDILIK